MRQVDSPFKKFETQRASSALKQVAFEIEGRGKGLHCNIALRGEPFPLALPLPLQARPMPTGVIGVCITFISGKGVHMGAQKKFFFFFFPKGSGAAKVAAFTEFILNF